MSAQVEECFKFLAVLVGSTSWVCEEVGVYIGGVTAVGAMIEMPLKPRLISTSVITMLSNWESQMRFHGSLTAGSSDRPNGRIRASALSEADFIADTGLRDSMF